MRFSKLLALGLVAVAAVSFSSCLGKKSSTAKPKIFIYTSMKDSLIRDLKEDFLKKNPDLDMDYTSAGAGSLMAKVAAERQSGKIAADIIWTSEVPDFFKMKNEGILLQYRPNGIEEIQNPLVGTDDYFVPARLGTLGIVYNTNQVKTAPATWAELATRPEFKGAFSIADPSLSGTSFVSVAMLQSTFGDDFFRSLRKNGASIGKGSGQVVDDTASGEIAGCIGVDYITFDKIDKGATLAMAYPKELLLVPSPIAIFNDTKQAEAAKRFIDYIITKDAQQIITGNGTLPVRDDVQIPAKYNLPGVDDAVANGIVIDYQALAGEREDRIASFKKIMTE